MTAPRVGIVGLGTMGAPMARNLAKAGFPLALATRTTSKARALASELGGAARAFERFADVGRQSDVLVTSLPDAPEVEAVLFGPDGAAEGLSRGAIVIDTSTIAAESARAFAERLSERGVSLLDAPVSGGQKGAVEGTLTFFVGGDAASLERARPVFSALGKRVTHLGPSGAGQLGKATNQILVAGNLMALSEAMAFAARVGLPLPALHEALSGGAANSWALEVLGKKMIARDFAPGVRDQAPAEGPRDPPEDGARKGCAASRSRARASAAQRPRSAGAGGGRDAGPADPLRGALLRLSRARLCEPDRPKEFPRDDRSVVTGRVESSGVSHPPALSCVGQQPIQRPGERGHVSRTNEKSAAAVRNDLGDRRRLACDDGKSRRHRLEEDDSESLLLARQTEEVRAAVVGGERVEVHVAEQLHAIEPRNCCCQKSERYALCEPANARKSCRQ